VNALEAYGLGKRYGARWALRDCSLAMPAGHVVGLVGPNGAGKTTLLHLAVGLLAPTSGRIELFGLRPGRSRDALARVGFVAQDAPLYDDFTVAETLTIGRRLNRRWNHAWAERRMRALSIPGTKRVGELSGGQRAQVALALALAKEPELLLLDEPVARLDPLARREFLQSLMDAAAERSLTVVLSSHLIADLERTCDFVIVLREAEVRLSGEINEVVERHRLLIGPRERSTAGAGVGRVIRASYTDRQATLLVEASGPIADPAWEAHPVDLEEIVLAYLGEAGRPRLEAVPSHEPRARAWPG
jgi:ABC-2 type transport system ATP-binding protein